MLDMIAKEFGACSCGHSKADHTAGRRASFVTPDSDEEEKEEEERKQAAAAAAAAAQATAIRRRQLLVKKPKRLVLTPRQKANETLRKMR